MARNLKKDLELCNKATKGPWYTGGIDGVPNRLIATTSFFGGGKVYTRGQDANPGVDAEFIAEARTGWPEAIKRSIEAEAKILELENRIDVLSTVVNMYCSPYYDMEDRADEAEKKISLIVNALDGLRLVMDKGKCDKAYAYMERLADDLFVDASYDIIEDTYKKLSVDAGRCCSEV